jgi:hypothetical protein
MITLQTVQSIIHFLMALTASYAHIKTQFLISHKKSVYLALQILKLMTHKKNVSQVLTIPTGQMLPTIILKMFPYQLQPMDLLHVLLKLPTITVLFAQHVIYHYTSTQSVLLVSHVSPVKYSI